ncbi:hypothetical protein RS130_23090 [Paraglaciecola aquimarina]|uniref:Uncharacterized protein n=1 Tax=Paraglaciecola aquimarina TaxID=1235557 RepID=A0ABU3T2F8_9ALTE|nr:hypothetical protein [Paraglaciecola aquimarina]MDU0356393.1 hypothetical protein [Paraglaciecola aquimarina]
MNGLSKFVLILLAFGALSSSYAADSVNLLVMIEDADKDSIARDSRINKRVHTSVSQQLNHIVNVYDETAITLNQYKQGRTQRSDAELLDIARSVVNPPIDLVVIFSTYASVQTNEYSKKAQARIQGRMLDAKSGQFLDSFEVQSSNAWAIPYTCVKQACILEEIGNEATGLGDELGFVLAEKLDWLINGENPDTAVDNRSSNTQITSDFYLQFDGFSPQEVARIEEYLLVFSGYISHRPTEQRHTRTTILYRTNSSTAKLNRNILRVLAELDMRATIHFQGNKFNLKRITFRGDKPHRDITQGW